MMRTASLLLLLAILPPGAAMADSQADSLFVRGNWLFDDGRYAEAADVYRSIENLGYESTALNINLGLALERMRLNGQALYYFTRSARKTADRSPVNEHLDRVRLDLSLPPEPFENGSRPVIPVWIWTAGVFITLLGVLLRTAATISPMSPRWSTSLIALGLAVTLASIGWSAAAESRVHGMVIRGPASVYEEAGSLAPTGSALIEGQQVLVRRTGAARVFVETPARQSGWIDRHRVREF